MIKRLALVAVVLGILLAATGPAWAGYFFEDPIFQIGDRTVSVMIGVDAGSDTVSQPTQVRMLVPRNLAAAVLDANGCDTTLSFIGAQRGPYRICMVLVRVPRSDQGNSFPVMVTVSDDAGFSFTASGRAGSFVVVPYIQRAD